VKVLPGLLNYSAGPLALNRSLREPQKIFLVSFENAQRFQNSPFPSFQAAKPRFTKKAPAAEQLPFD